MNIDKIMTYLHQRKIKDSNGIRLWLDEFDIISSYVDSNKGLYIGQKVYHEAIYGGEELMEIVGIRESEVELMGDWSGGTHGVSQKGWMSIERLQMRATSDGGSPGEMFDKSYCRIVEQLKGKLTNEEYRELVALEWVMNNDPNKQRKDNERYKELNDKKYDRK